MFIFIKNANKLRNKQNKEINSKFKNCISSKMLKKHKLIELGKEMHT